jgi:hypothetical protein
MQSRRELFLFNSAISALIISFLTESLPLKIIYSTLFLGGAYYLQLLLFLNGEVREEISENARKMKSLYLYLLGLIAGLCVLFLPSFDSPPTSQPLYFIFANIPVLSLIRVVFGYFLLGIFPGLALLDIFLANYKFDIVEKVGLTLALSYAFNAFIGAMLISIFGELFTLPILITILLGGLTLMKLIKAIFLKTGDAKVDDDKQHEIWKPTIMILLFSFLLLILSSYTLVFSSDIKDMDLSGDITDYISYSNEIKLGSIPTYLVDRPLLYVFTLVASALTGLHVFVAYAGLQFYLLLFPSSIYTLLKSIFPSNNKIPAVGAFLSSFTSGLGFIGLWDFYSRYSQSDLSGRAQALLNAWSKAPLSFIPYQFFVMPLAYSILFLGLAFLYRSTFPIGGKTRNSDVLLCGLLASILAFTHSIFEFSFFIISLIILSIFTSSKRSLKPVLLKVAGATIIFFTPFEVTTKVYWYTFVNYLFHIEHFFGYPNPLQALLYVTILTTAAVILVYFFMPRILGVIIRKVRSHTNLPIHVPLIKLALWIFGITIFVTSIYYWRTNWSTLYYPQNLDWPPWYIVSLSYGFYLPLTMGLLPNIVSAISKDDKKGVYFLLVSTLAILVLIYLSVLLPSFFTPLTWSRRWLFFATHFLIITTAIGLSSISRTTQETSVRVRIKLKFKALKSALNPPINQCMVLIFMVMLALSNLTPLYTVETFYTSAVAKNNVSSDEADALRWLYYNSSQNSSILTFSDDSAQAIRAIALRKTLSYSDASGSWPIQLLFISRLPEITLYSLKSLGVTHVFIGPKDVQTLNSRLKGSYLNYLLSALPVVYQKGEFTIYRVPEYSLYNDSNYILVTPALDFQNVTAPSQLEAFSDSFDGKLDKWIVYSGKWDVINGMLYEPGRGTWKGKWGLILSNISFNNFIFEYRARSEHLGDQYVWGVFRFVDDNNFYSFYIGNTTYQITEVVDGKANILSGGRHNLNLNLKEWVSVRIEAIFSTIKLYINGRLVATLSGWGLEGRIGLLTHSGYPTYYDDVKVVQLKVSVNSESALMAYQLASSALIASGVKFRIVPDISLDVLDKDKVYIFPYNLHLPKRLLEGLPKYIFSGAHIITFDPLFSSLDEYGDEQQPLLSSTLKLRVGGSAQVSEIMFTESHIGLPKGTIIRKVIYDDSTQLIIPANYTLNGQIITPYIIQKRVGSGTITYVHLFDFLNSAKVSAVLSQDLLKSTLLAVINIRFPEPVGEGNVSPPVPASLFKFLRVNDIPALLELKDIHNYIYAYSSTIAFNGSITVNSSYILMTAEQLKVDELQILNSTHSFSGRSINLSQLRLNGLVELSIEAKYLILSSSFGSIISTLELQGPFKIYVKLVDAELQFKTSSSDLQPIRITDGIIWIAVNASESNALSVVVKQPIIKVEGAINLPWWHGIFWHQDIAVASFRLHSAVLNGKLTLQLTYTYGGYIFKVISVKEINQVNWSS